MSTMGQMTKQAMAESKALHERAVREIAAWLAKEKKLIISRINGDVEYLGDFTYQIHPQAEPVNVLVKAEQKNIYGNFFLETWRDKSKGVRGWLHNECSAQWLAYYFVEDKELWMMSLASLKVWAFGFGRLEKFPEKVQSKRLQENDAWGRVVPITTLVRELGKNIHKYKVEE
jgi:hypothetical protein